MAEFQLAVAGEPVYNAAFATSGERYFLRS